MEPLTYNTVYKNHRNSANENDDLIDNTFEPVQQLKCGEIVLTNKRNVAFSCGFCECQLKNLNNFLLHILKEHIMLSKEEAKNMLQEVRIQNTFENDKLLVENNISKELNQYVPPHRRFSSTEIQKNYVPAIHDLQNESDDPLCHFDNLRSDSSAVGETLILKPNVKNVEYTENENRDDPEFLNHSEEYLNIKNGVNNDYVEYEIEILDNNTSLTNKTEEIVEEVICTVKKPRKAKPPDVSIKNFECKYCSKTYKSKALLKVHMKRHARDKPFLCELCDARFTDNCNLTVHLNRHLGIKPHRCSICEKSFTSTTEVKLHMRRHTGEKPYVCEQCGRGFSTSGQLLAHRRRHDNEKPFKCVTCGKDFYDRKLLQDHEVVHSSERPFKCSICSKTFTRKKALREHKKLHSGIRSYECKICKKSFAQNAGLWAHMKQNHTEPT